LWLAWTIQTQNEIAAENRQGLVITILKTAFCNSVRALVRSFESAAEFEEYFHEYDTLIIDGEEHSIQRPSQAATRSWRFRIGPPKRHKTVCHHKT